MSVVIRTAIASDASAIGDLARDFARYLRALGDPTEFCLTAEALLRDGFGRAPAFAGLVAEEHSVVIGYLLYHFGYDSDRARRNLYIVDLYVAEAARQRGVGRALMTEAAKIAREENVEEMIWSVYSPNDLANGFYAKLGAERITEVHFMRIKAHCLNDLGLPF